MPNPWFQFKEFTVQQEQSAMKVSTDACIFGAWVSHLWKGKPGNVLDVGTGTGLLSLMLLQQNRNCSITALEPELKAVEEATTNFSHSDWGDRVAIVPETLQHFSEQHSERKFDFLFCNPPFFQNHLLGEKHSRNQARHDVLTQEELAHYGRNLIASEGELAVIYPEPMWENWLQIANKKGLHPKAVLKIKPTSAKPINRVCGVFGLEKISVDFPSDTLLIRDEEGHYTNDFTNLLKIYYLDF